MSRILNYRLGVARLLLGLYALILTNGVVFRHTHRLSDGTIICHAHPYKSSPGTQFPNHTHNRDELIWLDAFSNALYAEPGLFVWLATVLVIGLLATAIPHPVDRRIASVHTAFRHRGPPSWA